MNKMPFFLDMFLRDEFQLLFWNLSFAHNDGQRKLKKEVRFQVLMAASMKMAVF
jgi:hypothetical protein